MTDLGSELRTLTSGAVLEISHMKTVEFIVSIYSQFNHCSLDQKYVF